MKKEQIKIPKITVLCAVFNGEDFLKEAIDSILNQTFTDFEFIIIDDGSTDTSYHILKSYSDKRIRLIKNKENIGLTRSLNIGLGLARGKYIARQDCDDISLKSRFEKQFNFLELNPSFLLVGCQAIIINENGKKIKSPFGWDKPITVQEIRWWGLFDNPFIHSAVMFRKKDIINKFDGYNEKYRTSQDFELWSQLIFKNKCANLNDSLLKFRYHENSIASNYSKSNLSNIAKIIEKNILKGTGHAPPIEFVNSWMHLFNSKFESSKLDMYKFMKSLDLIHNNFCSNNFIKLDNSLLKNQKEYFLVKVFFMLRKQDLRSSVLFLFLASKKNDIFCKIVMFLFQRLFKPNMSL